MNIVVLSGGSSTEREVSLVSGKEVYKALSGNSDNNVIMLDVSSDYSDSVLFDNTNNIDYSSLFTSNIDWEILLSKVSLNSTKSYFGENVIKLCQMADIVFLALHGENGEDGKIQAAFELLGIKYTGTDYLSSAISMNKALSKILFINGGIPTPKSFTLKKGNADNYNTDNLVFPKVLKVANGGSSIGVYIAQNAEEYCKYLQEAFEIESEVLVEDFVEGREFSVGVIDNKALPIIEIVPNEGFYDYKTKYTKGAARDICPAPLSQDKTEEMQRLAEKVFKILGLRCYSRIDFLMNKDGDLFCLEANTLPGMTPTSLLPQEAAVEGISFAELCEKLIDISLKN